MRGAVVVIGCGYGLLGLLSFLTGLFNGGIVLKSWAEIPGHWNLGLLAVAFLAGAEIFGAIICLVVMTGLLTLRRWSPYLTAGFNLMVLFLWVIIGGRQALERSILFFEVWRLVPLAFLIVVSTFVLSKPIRNLMVL